jgi:hypothetical protein
MRGQERGGERERCIYYNEMRFEVFTRFCHSGIICSRQRQSVLKTDKQPNVAISRGKNPTDRRKYEGGVIEEGEIREPGDSIARTPSPQERGNSETG